MNGSPSVVSTMEWLMNAVDDHKSSDQVEDSTPIPSTSNASDTIIDDQNSGQSNVTHESLGQQGNDDQSEEELININEINFDRNNKWKIRGIVSFKYDIRRFNNEHGDVDIFTFDFRDNSGEISITSYNLSARAFEPRIEKDVSYEITNLFIRTANDTYKSIPNNLQLTTSSKTTILEIMPLDVMPLSYSFVKLDELEFINLNSVIDIQCHVIRDYGVIAGETNNRRWIKKELHVMENNSQCRLTLWNNQARLFDQSLIRSKIICRYLKVKWFNGTKCLQSMDNSKITIDRTN